MKAEKLLSLIIKKGLKQSWIADNIGVKPSDLNTALKGKRTNKRAIEILCIVEKLLNKNK